MRYTYSSWSFWPVYVGTYVTGGTPMQITTSVGDQQYNHNYLATDYATFNATHQWDNGMFVCATRTTTEYPFQLLCSLVTLRSQ